MPFTKFKPGSCYRRAMVSSYFHAKRIIAFSIAAFFLALIATTELVWASSYAETKGTIVGLEQSCALGGSGRTRWGDCAEAQPGATRRTAIRFNYVSPADRQPHEAAVRCDTSGPETPVLLIGSEIDILAHTSEPDTIDRRRCTPIVSETA